MEKPEMKRVVAITTKAPTCNTIYFYANGTIAECAKEFWKVEPWAGRGDYWRLTVDARYDFDEIVAWLESFND